MAEILDESKLVIGWKAKYFTIWIGQAFSLFGSQVVQFAIMWWLAKSSDSATVLAIAGIAGLVPAVVLGPIVGALVDRWNRRLIMIAADTSTAILTLVVLLLFVSGTIENWHIYTILFLRSIAGSFHSISMQSSVALLVPAEQLVRVAGMRQTLDAGLSIGAPLLGALLVGLVPMEGIILIDTVTCLMAVVPLLFLSIPKHNKEGEALPTVWLGMREGFSFIWTWRGLRYLSILATFLNLFVGSITVLLPIMVTRHYSAAVGTLAAFESLFAVGMVLGGLVISVWGGFQKRIHTMVLGLVGLGGAISVFGLSPLMPFSVAYGAVLLAGVMIVVTNTPISALLQQVVPVEIQGRVFATLGSLAAAGVPLGLAVSGWLSDVFGILQVYFAIGVICSLIGMSTLVIPSLGMIERCEEAST